MFHIFYLNRGYMLRLEPPALGSIYDLQKCVANSAGIETQDQFLFLSGGASLSANTPLSSSTISGFGTDANPIFLVKRVANVQPEPVKENAEGINELYQGWVSGIERLDRISTNSSSAIAECVEMGKKCATVTETIVKFCSNIISEHQYLHQGWMAVIANLDDNVQRIQKRLDRALGQAEKLGMIQEKGRNLLADFDNVIEMLSKIIIPPPLLSTHALGVKNLSDSIEAEEMSLYDWISSKDQAYSLDAFSQHVLDHLDKTDDSDLREAQAFFGMVNDVAKKSQYRDIGGIDKRLAMLNSKLQHLEDCLAKVRESTSRIIQPVIQDSTQNVAIYQKQLLGGLKQPLKNLYDYALCFINSKDEVVKNISQRFSTWIRQAYQRLHECTKKIVIFEEKFAGLRQRLDLARQIKDAPNIYMTAVPEVIRREELKKEFSEWVKTHIDKCSTFIREENKIREEFQSKLERHFLCQLFAGMGDRIPQFTAQNPPKIDQNLPRISAQHLTELRRAFPNMKNMLIVCTPRIFPRLAIPDPNATFPSSSMAMGQSSQIRREQSFYDRERTSNIDAMNRNFPSTNWLSEENMELVSPSTIAGHNFLGMARGSTSLSASAIVQIDMHQSPPQELGPLSDQPVQFSLENSNDERSNRGSMSPLQPSAPISIPIASNNALHGDLIESIGSNHFSTPEEFGSFGSNSGPGRFIGAGGSNLRNIFPSNAFRCSPKITRPLSLIRASQQPAVLHEESPKKNEASQTTASTISSPIEFESKLMNAQNELKELAKSISTLREFGMHMQNFTISLDVSQLMHQFGNLINMNVATTIENYKKLAENENAKKIAEIEIFHHEQIDRLNGKIEQERRLQESKDQQIAELHAQINALNEQVYNLQAERSKTNLDETSTVENEEKKCDEQPMNDATQQMNHMAISQSMVEIREEQPQNPSSAPGSDEDEGIARLSSRSCSTQTKVRSRDMAQFVSLNEIYEGFGALIIWNGQMNAFMAHCSNPRSLPYIVKESCLEKLNIRKPPKSAAQSGESTSTAAAPTPQRTWAFVMVDTIEPCQIKKVSNRYNLPIETRFFRIAVKPMLGDFGSSLSSAASSIASSKR